MSGRPAKVTSEGGITMADVVVDDANVKELTIEINGKTGTVVYKDLTYWEKNLALSAATEYYQDETGNLRSRFHIEVYVEECLKRMITQAPFPVNVLVLRKLRREVGEQLAVIIPSAVESGISAATKKE